MSWWPIAILLTNLGTVVIGEQRDHPGYPTFDQCQERAAALTKDITTGKVPALKDYQITGGVFCNDKNARETLEELEKAVERKKGTDI